MDEITPGMLAVWQGRARAARNPFLRYRYADLVWDLTRLVTGKHPNIEFARTAIDAIIEGLGGGAFEYPVEAYRAARRGLTVGRSINDFDRGRLLEKVLFTYERAHATDSLAGTWGPSFDLLLEGE